MVYLLARDPWLCLLLDSRGDPAAVQSFVSAAWESFIDTQPQSLLHQALWLRGELVKELPAVSASPSPLPDVVPSPLTAAAARLSVRDAVRRLRGAPRSPCVGLTCGTAEALWTTKRISAQVRRALVAQARQVRPRAAGEGPIAQRSAEDELSVDNDDEDEDGGLFRHDMAVLVPIRLCGQIRGLTLRQVIDLCSQAGKANCCNSTRSPPISLVMNPLVSPSGNTSRREKNERLDGIRHAVLAQCYEAMTRTGSGAQPRQRIQQQQQDKRESFASFLRDASIGFDMQVMALSGGAVGYYIAHVRGFSTNVCIVYGIIGLILMLFVDAVLFILRVGRMDEQTRKERRQKWQLWHLKNTKSKRASTIENGNTDEAIRRAKKED